MVPVVTLCPPWPPMHLFSPGNTPGAAALTSMVIYRASCTLAQPAAATPSSSVLVLQCLPGQPPPHSSSHSQLYCTSTALHNPKNSHPGPRALMPHLKSYLCTLQHTIATTLSAAVLILCHAGHLIHLCASFLTWQDQPVPSHAAPATCALSLTFCHWQQSLCNICSALATHTSSPTWQQHPCLPIGLLGSCLGLAISCQLPYCLLEVSRKL